MTSYETSAIASSDDEDDIVPDSVGIIITSLTPIDFTDPYTLRDIAATHPLLDKSLWRFPIIHAHCHVESAPREYDPDSLHTLAMTAQDLADRGAVVVVTDTGFSSMQRDLATRVTVPVLCSAMVQLASLTLTSSRAVGVVTLDRQLVGSWNLVAVGAASDTPVIGLNPSSVWRQTSDTAVETSRMLYDLVEACEELIRRYKVDTIVLEEPRFATFTTKIQTRLRSARIFDLVTAVSWLYGGHKQVAAPPAAPGFSSRFTSGSTRSGRIRTRRLTEEDPPELPVLGGRDIPS